jgi:Luciferase-like monooxygenase
MQSNTDPIRFGLNLDPGIAPAAQLVEAVRLAERSGFDLIRIQDHPHNPAFFDTWTMLTHLAAKSERIAFTPNVANLGLRPPAMLAKAAATLAHLEGGRVVLGVGAGAVGPGVPSGRDARRRRGRHRVREQTPERAGDRHRLFPAGVDTTRSAVGATDTGVHRRVYELRDEADARDDSAGLSTGSSWPNPAGEAALRSGLDLPELAHLTAV